MGLEAKVGLFIAGCLILISAMSLKLVDFSFSGNKGTHIQAELKDASGLTEDAPVIFSGVEVGKVTELKLKDGKALVSMVIDKQYTLPANLMLSVRSKGFLGEKYAELKMAGDHQEGILAENATISSESGGTDFDQLGNKLGGIADDVKAITSSLKDVLATQQARDNMTVTLQNIREITDAVNNIVAQNENRVNAIMQNVDILTARLATITTDNQQGINDIVSNINALTLELRNQTPGIASNLKNITGNVDEIVTTNKDDIKGTLKNMNTITTKLETTVDNLNDITGKISEGKGTIGKLVNDEKTVDNLNGALSGLKDTLGKLNDFKVDLAFFAERYGDIDESKGHFTLKITPSEKRYYLLGINSHPDGVTKKTVTNVDRNYSSSSAETDYNYSEYKTERNPGSMTYTLMYAHRFWEKFHFRVGINESTAGLGLDYHPLKNEDKLVLSADVFDFPDKGDSDKAHAKVTAKYDVFKNIFVHGGYDDFLNDDKRSYFIGAGVQFRDDDLKYLLGKMPVPIN